MKTYSNKSNAKRAAIKQGLETFEIVQQEDLSWAIVVPAVEVAPVVEEVKEINEHEQELINQYGYVECPHCSISLFNGVGSHLDEVNGTKIKHEKFQFCCLGCDEEFGPEIQKVARKEKTKDGIKIEKNREEQNGVKRPSVGGLCRQVWDACDVFFAQHDKSPKPADLKETAIANGWNLNNVSIELYQWRKFNGLSKKK